MEPPRLSSLLFVVLAAAISVDAGVTRFEEQFIPTGRQYSVYNYGIARTNAHAGCDA